MAATNTKRRRRPVAGSSKGPSSRVQAEFAPGSLESDLSMIGSSVPREEWAHVPVDYFSNLDHYLRGAPKKK